MTTAPALAATDGGKIVDFLLDYGMEGSTSAITARQSSLTWYKVSSADEPPGKSGLAHFLERLIFKATTNRAGSEFDRAVSVSGGYNNAPNATTSFGRHDWLRGRSHVQPHPQRRYQDRAKRDSGGAPLAQRDEPAGLLDEEVNATLRPISPTAFRSTAGCRRWTS